MSMTSKHHGPASAVVAVDLGVSTAYAVRGARTILVDTGPPGGERRLLKRLARAGIDPDTITLIVLTHCHPDHAGAAAALRELLGVPIAVHPAEADWAAAGRSEFYTPIRPFGHLLLRMLQPTFDAFSPDVLPEDGQALDDYGVALSVLHTPGHTPGSITVLHRQDGDALVGDLLAGGMFRRDHPNLPFLAQDTDQITTGTRAVLAAGASRLHFGHGKPASALSVLRRFGGVPGEIDTTPTAK